MDYNKAFKFVLEDEQWVTKMLIFVLMFLLSFLIVPSFILSGYFAKIMKRVSEGEQELPEWGDWGELLGIGFKLFVVVLIVGLPMIILLGLFGFSMIASIMSGSEEAVGLLGAGTAFGMLLVFAYGLVMACILPAMMMQFVKQGYEIGAAFRFGDVFKLITDNVGEYVAAIGIFIGLSIAVSIIGGVTLYLGSILLTPYTYAVAAHLFGQIIARRTAVAHTAATA